MSDKNRNALSWSLANLWNTANKNTPPAKLGREKILQDYFELYKKSGILDFFVKQVRNDFLIPKLDPDNDIFLVVIPKNDTDISEEEKSHWYESLTEEQQKTLDKRIKDIIRQLYLSGSSYRMLLNYCLYNKIFSLSPQFDEYMIDCIAFGQIPYDEILGYTKREIKTLQNSALFYLKYVQLNKIANSELSDEAKGQEILWTKKQIELVPKRCEEIIKNIERKNRPLKTLELDIKIIQLLKDKYRKKKPDENNDATGEEKERYIRSIDIITDDLLPDIHFSKFNKKAAWFRKRVQELKKKYPFLKDFISSSNSSLG